MTPDQRAEYIWAVGVLSTAIQSGRILGDDARATQTLLIAADALRAERDRLRAIVDEQAIENGDMAAKGDALICAARAAEAERDEWKAEAQRMAANEAARRAALHDARADRDRLRESIERIGQNLMHEEDCAYVQPGRRKKTTKCDCWLVDVMPILDAALKGPDHE